MKRRTKLTIAGLSAACVAAATPFALAAPIPNATYNGRGTDGATVTLTLSPDGTLVTAYQVTGVMGDTCQLTAGGAPSSWPGTPVTNGSFKYQFSRYITFQGSFNGKQSASGTFYIHQDATKEAKACSSPTVNWTASTNSKPAGGGGNPGGGNNGGGKKDYATRVSLHKLSRKWIGGRLTSSDGACVSRRMVTLWRGARKLGHTRTGSHGTFSFARSGKVRGHAVRATVGASTRSGGICAAGSSIFVKA